MSRYVPSDQSQWTGRVDSSKPERIHQVIQCIDLSKDPLPEGENKTIAFLGFQSDEGVKRNLGRPGAYEGPFAIRQALSSLPYSGPWKLIDVGNIQCNDGNLEEAQQELGKAVAKLLKNNIKPILLGGGHEISWGHYQGLAQKDLAIVNFDAHYDLRKNQPSSGTPFLQIAEERKKQNQPFHYYCLGVQKSGNTETLFDRAKQLGVHTLYADQIELDDPSLAVKFIEDLLKQHTALYVTVCMDVFSSAFAPGVSAPQPLGISPWKVIPLLRQLAKSGKIVGIDFAEVAQSLDRDGQTAKLAACLIMDYLANDEYSKI